MSRTYRNIPETPVSEGDYSPRVYRTPKNSKLYKELRSPSYDYKFVSGYKEDWRLRKRDWKKLERRHKTRIHFMTEEEAQALLKS